MTALAKRIFDESNLLRIAVGVALPFFAITVQLVYWTESPGPYFLFLYPAVFFASWIAGPRIGVLAIVVCAVAADYFFLEPRFDFGVVGSQQAIALATFILLGASFAFLTNDLRTGTRRVASVESHMARQNIELRQALEDAQSANRAKQAFLATTSHELRTPLNAILGFTTLLLRDEMGPLSGEQRKALQIVNQSGENLFRLVQDILDFTSLEGGDLDLECQPVRLAPVLKEVCESLGKKALDRDLRLLLEDCDESLEIVADGARIGQVVRNLVTNALTYTDRGSVKVRVAVEDRCARIEVIDSGIGVPEEELHKLFRPFQPVHRGDGRFREGTGLGLAIAQQLIQAMHGEIGVASTQGVGSTFWVTVPLVCGGETLRGKEKLGIAGRLEADLCSATTDRAQPTA